MNHLLFRIALTLVITLIECAAFGQGGWSQLSPPLVALPAESTSTPWPRVAQITSLAPVAAAPTTPLSSQNYRSISDWTSNAYSSSCDSQATFPADHGISECESNSCSPCNPWYFSSAGLIMGREDPRRVWTTYETNNNSNQLMSTGDADPDWEGGFEVHIGRYFACSTYALDLGYWTIDDFQASDSQTHVNFVSTPLQFNDLEFGAADPVEDYFNTAEEHRISRRNTIQNVELNLLETDSRCGSCSPWSSRKSVGLRYFQFDEDLSLSTLDQGGVWGGNGGADEVTMLSSTENSLIGVQLGYQLDRQWGQRATFFIAPKFGIYNNHLKHRFDLRRGDGVAAMPSAFSGVTGSYPVEASANVLSFLTEVNLGVSWQPTCHLTLFGGYRAVALTGMGLADSQIPQFIIDLPEIANIDSQDSLILHGAFVGVAYSL